MMADRFNPPDIIIKSTRNLSFFIMFNILLIPAISAGVLYLIAEGKDILTEAIAASATYTISTIIAAITSYKANVGFNWGRAIVSIIVKTGAFVTGVVLVLTYWLKSANQFSITNTGFRITWVGVIIFFGFYISLAALPYIWVSPHLPTNTPGKLKLKVNNKNFEVKIPRGIKS